jgi:hypothetical protein
MTSSSIKVYDSTGHHVPTSELRSQVQAMCACGMNEEDIAYVYGCTPYEIKIHYKQELENGLRMTTAQVGAALLKNALKNNDTMAQQFWLKQRAGWSPPSKVELTGKDGNPIEVTERRKILDSVMGLMMKAVDPNKNEVPVK